MKEAYSMETSFKQVYLVQKLLKRKPSTTARLEKQKRTSSRLHKKEADAVLKDIDDIRNNEGMKVIKWADKSTHDGILYSAQGKNGLAAQTKQI